MHMKLVSIEPTPNPNSMKLNLDESLPKGVSRTYTAEDRTRPQPGEKGLVRSGRRLATPGSATSTPSSSRYRGTGSSCAAVSTPSSSWPTASTRSG